MRVSYLQSKKIEREICIYIYIYTWSWRWRCLPKTWKQPNPHVLEIPKLVNQSPSFWVGPPLLAAACPPRNDETLTSFTANSVQNTNGILSKCLLPKADENLMHKRPATCRHGWSTCGHCYVLCFECQICRTYLAPSTFSAWAGLGGAVCTLGLLRQYSQAQGRTLASRPSSKQKKNGVSIL